MWSRGSRGCRASSPSFPKRSFFAGRTLSIARRHKTSLRNQSDAPAPVSAHFLPARRFHYAGFIRAVPPGAEATKHSWNYPLKEVDKRNGREEGAGGHGGTREQAAQILAKAQCFHDLFLFHLHFGLARVHDETQPGYEAGRPPPLPIFRAKKDIRPVVIAARASCSPEASANHRSSTDPLLGALGTS